MKILLSFLQDTTLQPHAIPAYRFWAYYIKNGIEEAGMQWTEVPDADWAEGLLYNENSIELKEWDSIVWEKTLQYVKNNRPNINLFLTYLAPKQINVSAIAEIKKLGIPCVNFYCDNVREFNNPPKQFKVFDMIWVPEFEALRSYKTMGIKHIHLPMPMWVEKKFRTNIPVDETPSVTFIGSKDVLRQQLLANVLAQGLPVDIMGAGWRNDQANVLPVAQKRLSNTVTNQFGFIKEKGIKALAVKVLQQLTPQKQITIDGQYLLPKPNFEEYIHLTQNSSVVLGINRVPTFSRLHSVPLTYSRLRDVEAPMLGACYLTEYTLGLEQLYDLGNEIITYKTTDELVDHAKMLLNNKEKRLALRLKGQQKALQEHAIPVLLNKIKTAIFN